MAQRQMANLHAYISSQASEARADAYLSRVIAYCQGFSVLPHRGTRRDDLLPGLRTIGFERRITIAFQVTQSHILIEGVFYRGQDVASHFRGGEG